MNARDFTSVIEHLRHSARQHGDAPALVAPEEETYRQLYDQVRCWAAWFSEHELEKGDRVAIWLPKCTEYVVAAYAAMEVGGCYVPLDGAQPAERAKKILASAEPRVLVTDSRRFHSLDGLTLDSLELVVLTDNEVVTNGIAGCAPRVLGVVDLRRQFAGAIPEPVQPAPTDLAAMLFTSGSTGVPKGVQISHGNLNFFVNWALDEFDLSADDVFANHAGFHFDLSTFDYFVAAAVGAGVWMIRESEQRDVALLLEGMREHQVTVWYSVPSMLGMMVGSGGLTKATTESLRYVLFAGEVFPIKSLRSLKAAVPENCALYNLYGPTETNVCLYHRVTEADMDRSSPVPVGQPLPGVTARVVNEQGEDVTAADGIGELVISGPCVTPGYWRREDPVNADNHRAGCHATGDLVAREGDALCFHGRKDRMVKINGNRVELGEIEAALAAMDGIAEVAVLVQDQQIIAFYSQGPGAGSIGMLAIKNHCRDHLQRHMIPKRIWPMGALPKNANGKIDYLALGATAGRGRAAPQAAPAQQAAVAGERV